MFQYCIGTWQSLPPQLVEQIGYYRREAFINHFEWEFNTADRKSPMSMTDRVRYTFARITTTGKGMEWHSCCQQPRHIRWRTCFPNSRVESSFHVVRKFQNSHNSRQHTQLKQMQCTFQAPKKCTKPFEQRNACQLNFLS